IGKLPIPEADAKTQGEFAILVDKMLELKQREYAEKIPQARKILSRQIDGIGGTIDKAVYKLYGLTARDIEIIENA
ncbi:MAG: hypothetical protein LBO65_05835, partial [Spirochaetaceae bacterium]|nr:hypothetical protein [Spirochaetaceae bacterium]